MDPHVVELQRTWRSPHARGVASHRGGVAHLLALGRVETAEPETAMQCTPGPAVKDHSIEKRRLFREASLGTVDKARVCRSK